LKRTFVAPGTLAFAGSQSARFLMAHFWILGMFFLMMMFVCLFFLSIQQLVKLLPLLLPESVGGVRVRVVVLCQHNLLLLDVPWSGPLHHSCFRFCEIGTCGSVRLVVVVLLRI